MAKISKKRFLELAQENCIDLDKTNKASFIGQVYAELNKPKNKWIPWNGGECPVDPKSVVKVQFSNGDVVSDTYAYSWDWYYSAKPPISAYKVVDKS